MKNILQIYLTLILNVLVALPKRKIIVEEQKFPSPNVINIFFSSVQCRRGSRMNSVQVWILGFTLKPKCNFCWSKMDLLHINKLNQNCFFSDICFEPVIVITEWKYFVHFFNVKKVSECTLIKLILLSHILNFACPNNLTAYLLCTYSTFLVLWKNHLNTKFIWDFSNFCCKNPPLMCKYIN